MTPGQRYRLKTSTIAVSPSTEGRKIATMIPEGDIVEVLADEPVEGSQVLSILWKKQRCEMFTVDLRERGEMVKGASGGHRL